MDFILKSRWGKLQNNDQPTSLKNKLKKVESYQQTESNNYIGASPAKTSLEISQNARLLNIRKCIVTT